MTDLRALLTTIVDANRYMTLATADETGRPWASPVWFATADYCELFWVSKPEARHSRNLAVRPALGIVIFDSTQPPGTGRGVYLEATAREVPESELERGLAVFAQASEADGAGAWGRSDLEPPARLRLYHALAAEHFVLSAGDERLPVQLST